jgi:hypothetical protein
LKVPVAVNTPEAWMVTVALGLVDEAVMVSVPDRAIAE